MIKLKRGYDIRLLGHAEARLEGVPQPNLFALKPPDVVGIAPIPKLRVSVGDEVLAGEPLFFDKPSPDVQFCAPVSGEIVDIRRGPKRAVTEVVILADASVAFHEYGRLDPSSSSRHDIVDLLKTAGAWVLLRRRPFNILPDPTVTPRDIFVSCFDTAPLAPDYNVLIGGKEEDFSFGLAVLSRLTDGDVHLGVREDSADVFRNASHAKAHTFSGPHPAGAVGVQVHHVAPINKGDVVWTIKPQDVAIIGRLVRDGIFDARRTVALTGSEVQRTGYFDTRIGASTKPLLDNNLSAEHARVISGNVLTGKRIEPDGFIGLVDEQVTVIPEGDEDEFFGWLVPSYPRPSMSRTFPSFLFPNRTYRANSNNHGEERAFVMTGEYERVVPMDIYPQHLLKSILCQDFDQMEGLGIYEVVEEDLALCEFVCSSKQPVQQILREGLDALRIEG